MSLLRIACRAVVSQRSTQINFNQSNQLHRWVSPTLKEIRARRKKVGRDPIPRRSEFIDWNYDAEIYAFGVRLGEKFNTKVLQTAFIDHSYIVQEEMKQKSVGIENPTLPLSDNSKLMEKGEVILKDFITSFLTYSLPKLPQEGINGIYNYLVSEEHLSSLSSNIGTKDLILAQDFPVKESVLMNTFKAIVGALLESSGEHRTCEFIRDVVLVQLNQKDVNEYWEIEDPMKMLKEICEKKSMGAPELRLLGVVGKNTILSAYHVGIYCNKKMIGSGYGEDASIAANEAAKDSLRTIFGTNENMKPFDFRLPVETVMPNLKKAEATARN